MIMLNKVTNIITVNGTESDVLEVMDVLIPLNGEMEYSNYEPTKLDWNVVKFTTPILTPYETIVSLSEQYPNVCITVKFFDDDFGYNVGIYSVLGGEESTYYAPEDGSEEAMILSLKLTKDEYYLYEYICDLEDEELTDGIHGTDSFIRAIINFIYEDKIICDIYPIKLQEHLILLAVEDEDYEYASAIKNVINEI